MKNTLIKFLSAFLALVITISLVGMTLTSCSKVPASKEELQTNIDKSYESGAKTFDRVAKYLREWDFPQFDRVKFSYFESCFIQLYNMEAGLPKTLTHAGDTAKLFLDNKYDKIDLNDKTEVTDALLECYVTAVGDPYSIYRPPVETEDYQTGMSGSFGGIGITVEYNSLEQTIMVSQVNPGSPAEEAGIKKGDYIVEVDGHTIEEVGYDKLINLVRGEVGTTVDITLIRDAEFVYVTAKRAIVVEYSVEHHIEEETNLGYIKISSFKRNTAEQFINAVDELMEAGVLGIMFDLRGNHGGYVDSVCEVVSYLINDGETILSYQYKGRDRVALVSDDGDKDHIVDLPFVVLCDDETASAGEIFTSAIRDYRDDKLISAKIIGTTTYGKGIMQNKYDWIDGSSLTLTVAYYDPPCGENYHGKGITPDIIVNNVDGEDLQIKTGYAELLKLVDAYK